MWLPAAVYDPRRYRQEQILYDLIREAFDDRLPIHNYAPLHPVMSPNVPFERNRAQQRAVLDAVAHYQLEEHQRGEALRLYAEKERQMTLLGPNDPKAPPPPQPGQPRPPQPGQPGYHPPGTPQPGTPQRPPGTTPPSPDPNAPEPVAKPEVFREA